MKDKEEQKWTECPSRQHARLDGKLPKCNCGAKEEQNGWEESFDKEFYYKEHYGDVKLGDIKSFIAELLEKERAEVKAFYENCPQCTGLARETIKNLQEKVRGKKQPVTEYENENQMDMFHRMTSMTYNEAIDDTLSLLEAELK